MTTQADGTQGGGANGGGDGGAGNGNGGGQGNGGAQGGTQGDQNNQGQQSQAGANGGGAQGGDGGQEQLTEAQLAIAFQHPRFKELNEKAKKADQLQKAADDAEAERLKAAGEHEKLAEQYKTERDQQAAALKTERTNNAIVVAASKLGAHDPTSIAKLVDSGKITIDDNGVVSGVDDAIKDLQKASPYLFKTGAASTIGGGDTNGQGGQGGDSEFTLSQFKDNAFYSKNQKAMDTALANGKVDMTR